MVKFKKTLSLLLASLMLASSATIAASAAEAGSEETVGAYNNQTYLENYANAAYNEKNLGSTYSPSQTVFKTWSPDATDVKVKVYKTGSDGESGSGVVGTYNPAPVYGPTPSPATTRTSTTPILSPARARQTKPRTFIPRRSASTASAP